MSTGDYYAFYVVAVDFNSVSEPSPETVAAVCLPPYHIENPHFISAQKTEITLGWKEPTDDGGCPILGYELLVNDGLGGDVFTAVDVAAIQNRPYITKWTVSGLTLTGNFYKFKIKVINEIDSLTSGAESMLLAAPPDTPTNKPWQIFALTTQEQIRVEYEPLTVSQNGGSEVLGYELWRDDGQNGDFLNLYRITTNLGTGFTDKAV